MHTAVAFLYTRHWVIKNLQKTCIFRGRVRYTTPSPTLADASAQNARIFTSPLGKP